MPKKKSDNIVLYQSCSLCLQHNYISPFLYQYHQIINHESRMADLYLIMHYFIFLRVILRYNSSIIISTHCYILENGFDSDVQIINSIKWLIVRWILR